MTSKALRYRSASDKLSQALGQLLGSRPMDSGKQIIRENREQLKSQRSVSRKSFGGSRFNVPFSAFRIEVVKAFAELESVSLPIEFAEEGVEPSQECRLKTRAVLLTIENNCFCLPSRIGASLEGGIMLVYRFEHDRVVEVEVDNDLDISCVVSEGTTVVDSIVFNHLTDFIRFVRDQRFRSTSAVELRQSTEVVSV